MYYLNAKNEYEGSILKITDLNLEFFDFKDDSDGYGWSSNFESIRDVYEIDENNFIFFLDKGFSKQDEYLNRSAYLYKSKFFIEKIKLKKVEGGKEKKGNKIEEEEEKEDKIDNKINNNDEDDDDDFYDKNIDDILYTSKVLLKLNKRNNIPKFIILKKKYLLILDYFSLYVIDLLKDCCLRKYNILKYGEDNLYKDSSMEIAKWNCSDDNEFIINIHGNITLFKFEDEPNLSLKIISFSYFKGLNNLEKLNEDNKFYKKRKDYIIIY